MESVRSDDGCAERSEAAIGRFASRSSAGGGWVVVVRAEAEVVTLFWVESVERVGRSAVRRSAGTMGHPELEPKFV